MKITIEIEPGTRLFRVTQGKRYAPQLCFDEMIAQVIHLTFSGAPGQPRYEMLTKKGHHERRLRWPDVV